jgi:hypothetical protein
MMYFRTYTHISLSIYRGVLGAVLLVDGNRTALGTKGGVELLLAAMRTHAASAAVMEQACGALRSLAVNGTIDIACKYFCVLVRGREVRVCGRRWEGVFLPCRGLFLRYNGRLHLHDVFQYTNIDCSIYRGFWVCGTVCRHQQNCHWRQGGHRAVVDRHAHTRSIGCSDGTGLWRAPESGSRERYERHWSVNVFCDCARWCVWEAVGSGVFTLPRTFFCDKVGGYIHMMYFSTYTNIGLLMCRGWVWYCL